MAALLLGAAAASSCTPPQPEISQSPIPVTISGGLAAQGGPPGSAPAGALLIDTGTVLSTLAGAADSPLFIQQGDLSLWDSPAGGLTPVRRADFVDVPLLHAPLAAVGVGGAVQAFSAILAGDLLSQYALGIDYTAPAITLGPGPSACSCQLADACEATFPFTLAGGGSINLGDQVHTFPPTRVTLDACLETVADPVTVVPSSVECRTTGADGKSLVHNLGYEIDQPPGEDVRLLVATGFPGLLLGASAWDRLRGKGAAAALLAGTVEMLHFAGRSAPVRAAHAVIGDPATCARGSAATPCIAMALVGREGLLGACGELARSRRLRWRASRSATDPQDGPPDCNRDSADCGNLDGCLRCIDRFLGTSVCGDPNRCNDANQPVAAVIELGGTIDLWVVDDTAPELQEVNADLRPLLSDAEGIVGTSVLSRLALRIDYPHRRVIAHCADGAAACKTLPRYACPQTVADCGPRGVDAERLCNPPTAARMSPVCKAAPSP